MTTYIIVHLDHFTGW